MIRIFVFTFAGLALAAGGLASGAVDNANGLTLNPDNTDVHVHSVSPAPTNTSTSTALSSRSNDDPTLSFAISRRWTNIGNMAPSDVHTYLMEALAWAVLPGPWITPFSRNFSVPIAMPCYGRNRKPGMTCMTEFKVTKTAHKRTNGAVEGLLMRTIARAVEKMVLEREKSCWMSEERHFESAGYFCNVPDFVSVKAPDGAQLDFRFESHKGIWHGFDCVGVLTPVNNVLARMQPKFSEFSEGLSTHSYCLDNARVKEGWKPTNDHN